MKCSFSEKIVECLQLKVEKHNERHPAPITLDQLMRVYKRGERVEDFIFMPTKTTAQWAMARVNMFLRLAADQRVSDCYEPQDQDIIKGLDRTHEQEMADPFWGFTEGHFISARCDLLLARITDAEANKLFSPPSIEELEV
jgi:hypothetical protein